MKKVVVDSSVIVKWINRIDELNLKQADSLLSQLQVGKIEVLAPEIARYEVGNSLLNKKMELPLALDALATFYSLPITYFPPTDRLAFEGYEMAKEAKSKGYEKVTFYDTSFNALAKQENAVLITDNPKHQAKISGVRVIPLGEFK